MSEGNPVKPGKKTVSMKTAIVIISIGGVLFLLSIVIPTVQGTTAQTLKIGMGALGLAVMALGSYLRPVKQTTTKI